MTDLRYPIGRFDMKAGIQESLRGDLIESIAGLPAQLRAAVEGLSSEQMDTPYRPDGWTVRQVVHHVPDSHMNAYVRHKLALTEQEPTIKPYDESAWAELSDSRDTPVGVSLHLLESLHRRWVNLWRAQKPEDFARTFRHPEMGLLDLETLLRLYDWHGRHHTAHITSLRDRMGW